MGKWVPLCFAVGNECVKNKSYNAEIARLISSILHNIFLYYY